MGIEVEKGIPLGILSKDPSIIMPVSHPSHNPFGYDYWDEIMKMVEIARVKILEDWKGRDTGRRLVCHPCPELDEENKGNVLVWFRDGEHERQYAYNGPYEDDRVRLLRPGEKILSLGREILVYRGCGKFSPGHPSPQGEIVGS